jgi:hypothetical protein
VALGLLLNSWGSGLSAQTTEQRATACAAGGGDPAACAAAAVSARQVIAQIGLMTSPGAEIPGEGSTLGRRLGGMPRIAAWIRGAAQPVSVPEPADPNGPEEASAWTPTLQAGLALGVFDGFQLLPTVGGFLSLDVVGHTDFLFLSDGSGFADRVDVLSFGARVGLLQESFTLPGVSVSITRRLSGDAHLGDIAAGDAVEVVTDPSITSFRLTVSKDFLALGFLAGVGWDDVSGDTRLVVPDGLGDPILSDGGFEASRRMFFGSVSKQLGILAWATVEAGWAEGFDPVAGYVGAFDPSGSTLFGSVSLLLKL